jgi:hypothetical protein
MFTDTKLTSTSVTEKYNPLKPIGYVRGAQIPWAGRPGDKILYGGDWYVWVLKYFRSPLWSLEFWRGSSISGEEKKKPYASLG